MVLPSVLNSAKVIVWKKEKDRLQVIENGVWRKILAAPGYAPVVTLQGEIGCSSVEARDMKGKLSFARYMVDSDNGIMRRMWVRIKGADGGCSWGSEVGNYLGALGVSWEELETWDRCQIVEKVNEWEKIWWIEEISRKSTLGLYLCLEEKYRRRRWI